MVGTCCTIFGGENGCNLFHLTTKHDFENFGGNSCLPLVAGLKPTCTRVVAMRLNALMCRV